MPRVQSYHLHLPYLFFDNNHELNKIYFIRVIRELINKLILFFIPLFLFELGQKSAFIFFPLSLLSTFQRGIILIALYYLILRLVILLSSIQIAKLMIKISIGQSLFTAQIIRVIFFISLSLVKYNPLIIFFAVFIDAFQVIIYWNSYHYFLSQNSKRIRIGGNLGFIQFLLYFAAMIAPAIGGFLIIHFGYQILFFIGIIFETVNIIFSLSIKMKFNQDNISWKEFFNWMKEKTFRRLAVSFAGRYINDAVLVVWPLYVFFIIGAIDKVGFLYSFSIFLAMMISFFGGLLIDRYRSRRPFFISGGFLFFIWLIRTQITAIWSIVFVDMFDRLTSSFHWLFFDRAWLLRGKGREALSYFIYRELISSITALFFWSIFIAFFIFFPNSWQGLFIFASIGVILSLLIKDHKEE